FKYNLPLEKGIDEQGRMTELAGPYQGMEVKAARKKVIEDLQHAGLVIKQLPQEQNVGVCWRCHSVIEFLQVENWFIRILDFKEQVLRKADEIRWFPEFMKVRLRDWVESLSWDWVISRQRYFATPIPVWECKECKHVVPAKEEDCYVDPTTQAPPVAACPKCGGELVGCPDVFDTWMDSSISPLYNTFWGRDEEKFKRLYPMSMRPQSHDIIRTWAFYTILRELLITDEKPWDDIMIHGFIMAPDGTPMHTSLGNVIDPMPILAQYGADAVRYYASTCALGEDAAFREKDVIHGKKLATKIWNLGKLLEMNISKKPTQTGLRTPELWILSKYSRLVQEVTGYYETYAFDKVMRAVEEFAWHEFADHYVEMVKHRAREGDEGVLYTLYTVYLGILKMMAPIMPHMTEDAYLAFAEMDGSRSIHKSAWPEPILFNAEAEAKGELLKNVVAAVRTWKSERKLPLNCELELLELVGAQASLLRGSENDIAATLKAKHIIMEETTHLEERVAAIRPVKAKIGPTFKTRGKEVIDALNALTVEDAGKALRP
ncbi:MAG: class I tRNA ligase family protein, partial [Methanomassiliicoccales archaeon]